MVFQHGQDRWGSIFRLITKAPDLTIPSHCIAGKTVLITGAGGSIASTLAHELGKHSPRNIVLLDAAEQSLYRIDRELCAPHHALLGSVCDRALLDDLFHRLRPQIVFHAAAFKHVPLMEFNPIAAVQNNAIGTFILAQSAAENRVDHFVMVSTDKAVEPVSIMGASKRVAELVMLAMQSSATQFKAVRLGNVLASEGSVLPLFQSQIDNGKQLTVTHPDASRYFLTLEHAAQLLLNSLSDEVAPGLLVPELGQPIRIAEIADAMLAQAGDASGSKIVFTGLRPGDKISEKLVSDSEAFTNGNDAPLRPIRNHSPSFGELQQHMHDLEQAARKRDLPRLLRVVLRLVPDYQPSAVVLAAQHEYGAARAGQ